MPTAAQNHEKTQDAGGHASPSGDCSPQNNKPADAGAADSKFDPDWANFGGFGAEAGGATKIETSFGFGDFDGGDAGFDGFGDSAG